ncbi:hypothetical protein C823_006352 [Eubacterium plexicaudatum ASF492]|uniref:ESAT-6-like protein n=1 Tax=Eubacterium plexicaudatum ASF492 TaxID=1235802 RepID=N2AEC0_9FIRM|nr:hypothetical protein C823_006352 [Eubacterium plexicaudatum ASF492]
MTGTLKVSTAKLRSTASNFQSTGQHIQRMTSAMTNIVNQLSGRVWSGEAADAYKRKFGQLQDDINRMVKMINEHVTDLNAMAGEYERAENANKNMINSLKDDIIS